MALQRLKDAAEKAKIELSTTGDGDQPALYYGGRDRAEAPGAQADAREAGADWLRICERSLEPCKKAIAGCGCERRRTSTKWCWSAARRACRRSRRW